MFYTQAADEAASSQRPIKTIRADRIVAVDAYYEKNRGLDAIDVCFTGDENENGETILMPMISLYHEQILKTAFALICSWFAIELDRLRRGRD